MAKSKRKKKCIYIIGIRSFHHRCRCRFAIAVADELISHQTSLARDEGC